MNPMVMMTEQVEGNGIPSGGMPPLWPDKLRAGLLLTVGPLAEAVAAQTEVVSARALSSTPPLWRLAVAPVEPVERMLLTLHRQVNRLCAEIAAAQAPSTDSWSNPGPAEDALQVWLLLDTSIGEGTTNVGEINGIAEQRISWALQLLQLLDVAAWQHLRMAITPECLILLNTAQQHTLDLCRRRLDVMLPGTFHVLGFRAQEATAVVWQQRAATVLTALLWTDVTTQGKRTPHTIGGSSLQPSYYAVGAATWFPPTGMVKRTCALLTAQALVRQGWEESVPVSTAKVDTTRKTRLSAAVTPAASEAGKGGASLEVLVEQLLRSGEELGVIVPAPQASQWRRPRGWRRALQPVRMLLAQYKIQQNQQHTEGRQARQRWLATHLSMWEAAWQPFNRTQLVFGADPDQLATYEKSVARLRQQVLKKAQAIDEWLAGRAAATTRTADQVQTLSTELDAFCANLPVLSLVGIGQVCSQPQQWPRWCWQLAVSLPWRLRTLARSLAAQEQATYDEANGHVLRQLGLALLQDVQLQMLWLPEIRAHLNGLATYLDEQVARTLQELPAPYDRDRIDALRRQLLQHDATLLADAKTELSRLLQRAAADEWTDGALETVGEEMIARLESPFQRLDTWSVDDWISALFPTASNGNGHNGAKSQATEHAALFVWLKDLAMAAAPLWSLEKQAYQGNRLGRSEVWLVLPKLRSGRLGMDSWWLHHQRDPGVATWLRAHPAWRETESAMQGVILVQRVGVG